jgi:hypothetical protein
LLNLELIESGNTYLKLYTLAEGSAKVVSPVVPNQSVDFDFALDKVRLIPDQATFELFLSGVDTVETFTLSYNYYEGEDWAQQTSGAYIFRPKSSISKAYTSLRKISYFNGTNSLVVLL